MAGLFHGSVNGVSSTLGTVHLGDISFGGTDLAATNLTFGDVYTTSNGVGASGLLGLGKLPIQSDSKGMSPS